MNEQEKIAGCTLGLTPQMLSDWHDQTMISSTAETLRLHILTCAACQQYLTAYGVIDAAVRRFEPSAALAAFAAAPLHETVLFNASDVRGRQNAMNHHHLRTKDIDEQRSQPASTTPHPVPISRHRARSSLVGLGAVAAMLLVALIAVALFRYPYLFGGAARPTIVQHGFRYPLFSGQSRDVTTLDPALAQDTSSAVPTSLIFPGLLTQDNSGTPIPWAAASEPIFDATRDTYTFTLHSGLTWSDGTPIDANTFAYSLNRVLNPCTHALESYYLYPIKDAVAFANEKCASDGKTVEGHIATLIGDSLQVPDPITLVIVLAAPAPYFPDALTTAVASAQPKQLIDRYGNSDQNASHQPNWTLHLTDAGGFGGNLYKVKSWGHTGHLTLTHNLSFWGTRPKLAEIDFTIYPLDNSNGLENASAAEYSDYLAGRLDVGMPPPAQYQQAKQRSDFQIVPFLAVTYLQPNWTQPPFDDVRVRQAFALAINKATLATEIYHDTVFATNHIVPSGMYGYFPGLYGPDGTMNLAGNLPLAQQLMQQYSADKCGGKLRQCPTITLYANTEQPTSMTGNMDQAVIHMWQRAFPGYPITFDYSHGHALIPTPYVPTNPQIIDASWIADYADPQDWLSLQFLPGALGNNGNVSIPAATALMTQADQDLNPTERLSDYNQAEQLLVNEVAWIPLFQQKLYYNVPGYVKNLTFTPSGMLTLATWQQLDFGSH